MDKKLSLGEFWRESPRGACVDTCHTEDALRVVELLPIKIEDRDLHRTGSFALFTVRTFYRVAMNSEETVLLEGRHYSSYRANVPAPESRDSPSRIDESNQDSDVDPCESGDSSEPGPDATGRDV